MTIEKLFPSGDLLISDIVYGKYIKQRYFGYTRKEAKRLFREYVREFKSQIFVNKEK